MSHKIGHYSVFSLFKAKLVPFEHKHLEKVKKLLFLQPVFFVDLCRFWFSHSHFFNHTDCVGCMYSTENPKNFCLPVSCFYLLQRVMLLLCAKTSFQTGSPFTTKRRSECFTNFLVFGSPTFTHK